MLHLGTAGAQSASSVGSRADRMNVNVDAKAAWMAQPKDGFEDRINRHGETIL